jgi:hypothetical protein
MKALTTSPPTSPPTSPRCSCKVDDEGVCSCKVDDEGVCSCEGLTFCDQEIRCLVNFIRLLLAREDTRSLTLKLFWRDFVDHAPFCNPCLYRGPCKEEEFMLLLAREAREDTLKYYAPFCKQEFIGYLIHYHKRDLRKENPEDRLPENDDELLILLSIELHMDTKNGLDDLLISVKKWVSFSKPLLAEVKMRGVTGGKKPEVPGGKMRRSKMRMSERLKNRDDKKPEVPGGKMRRSERLKNRDDKKPEVPEEAEALLKNNK